tara:strand:+ start:23347 stop:23682 length:336 start_codon:yes stop_codon:yes gene_type:complete
VSSRRRDAPIAANVLSPVIRASRCSDASKLRSELVSLCHENRPKATKSTRNTAAGTLVDNDRPRRSAVIGAYEVVVREAKQRQRLQHPSATNEYFQDSLGSRGEARGLPPE